jgi:hypothetical protein
MDPSSSYRMMRNLPVQKTAEVGDAQCNWKTVSAGTRGKTLFSDIARKVSLVTLSPSFSRFNTCEYFFFWGGGVKVVVCYKKEAKM